MYREELERAVSYARTFLDEGSVASYIPQLMEADPRALGACIALMNGDYYMCGDCETRFTMQSISKPVALLLALKTSGYSEVFSKVGMEPSGDPFNSIKKLETASAKPLNPMINAGAIVVSSLIKTDDPFADMLSLVRKLTRDEGTCLDEKVYLSEKSAGLRNRAMAYFMASEGILDDNVETYLDNYFRMCSIGVTAKGLSTMGLILANDGTDPVTNEEVCDAWMVRLVKSIMITCGLYDASGEFAVKVGIPSKSGVGGGIVSSVTNLMGIGTYGPALDKKGNSVGGLRVLEYLSQALKLHMFAKR